MAVGNELTVTTTLVVAVQLFTSVTVTLYVVVVRGATVSVTVVDESEL